MLGNQAKSDLIKSQSADAPRNHSKFPLSHHHYTTLRFGEIAPFFEMESVAGDKISLRSAHKLSTFTLKSPILSDVHLNKDYFNVPMEAILPFNWDKIYANPVVGDDVSANYANCIFKQRKAPVTLLSTMPFARLMLFYLVYGKSSIASRLGINLNPFLTIVESTKAEYDIDSYITKVIDEIDTATKGNTVYVNYYNELAESSTQEFYFETRTDLRKFRRFCESHFVFSISISPNGENIIDPSINNCINSLKNVSFKFNNVEDIDINISSILAYQIVCAHYYTNDKVDYVYSAELYRQLLKSYVTNINRLGTFVDYFEYNGLNCPYDYASGYNINRGIYGALINYADIDSLEYHVNCYYYIYHIFKINRSLRYSDFFTGAKVRPLAVGDVVINVNANQVSAVDVTRNIQAQRFLNFVNRVGRKFEEYVGKLSGVFVKPDYHNPQYLGATKELLFNSKLENTANQQWSQANSVTSQYIGNSKDYAFEFDSDRPSIVLGLISFDIERAYNKSISPEALHIDRFDYFNPFMQHIGDQEVPLICYDASLANTSNAKIFGYQTRHAEYKEKYSYCDGGFNDESLPSWLFVNKPTDEKVISPEVIRSYPEEFDEFYLMLNGVSSDYFHFIVDFYNICDASRPMIKSPNIL